MVSDKVKLTLDELKQLFPVAVERDTLLPYVQILMQWAEQAEQEIYKLQEEITRRNFERSGQFG